MMTNSPNQLIDLIRTLENISQQLNDTLKQERDVLNSHDSQQLIEISANKKSLVLNLENHTKTTHIFLRNMNINKGLYGLSDLISKQNFCEEKTQLSDLWLNIQTLSDDNKKLNDTNGSVIELNRRYTQRSLDVLRGQVGSVSATYGADGHAMKSKISRNISIA